MVGEIFNTILIEPLANGLKIFYDILFDNLGLAIIGFSAFLRLITIPLTRPYMESMKKMREIAPEVEKLKKKHKDKIKFSQAQADLYKQKGISPAAGCLPYLLQIVILFGFFRMFTLVLSSDLSATEAFNQLLYPPLQFEAGEIVNTQFLYLDLGEPDVINVPGLPFPIPGPLLVLAAIAQFLSAKIMQPYNEQQEKVAKSTKESSDDLQASLQKSMIYTFPVITLLVGVSFPSGLALYWLIFSLLQLIQQYKSTGFGGLTPWAKRFAVLKSAH